MKFSLKIIFTYLLFSNFLISQELIIGNERVEPGVIFVFEGAIKDMIYPKKYNLSEDLSNVHIEARVNWDNKNIPKGAIKGGFVPYLKINAVITNQKTGLRSFVDLVPHINLIDNFHYARNISLPGKIDDKYQVEFIISNSGKFDLSYHKDWYSLYSDSIISENTFKYLDVSFYEIARLTRK